MTDDRPPAVTTNTRAFRVLVRNALFRRVELAALRRWDELGALDADDGWDAAAWEEALRPYWDEHDEIGTGPDARGPALLIVETGVVEGGVVGAGVVGVGSARWRVRQILDDPAGDHDWGISAEIDLAESDQIGAAAVHITDVGQLG